MCNIFSIDVQWPQGVSTSPWIPQLAYVIFMACLAVLFVSMQIAHMLEFLPRYEGFYFVYLTNWTLFIETVTMVLLFSSCLWGYLEQGEPRKTPMFVRSSLALWYISQPMSMIVMLLYWTTVNEFWDPYPIPFESYWAHLFTWMVLLVQLFMSNIPWSIKNFVWTIIYSAVYFVWTIIHYFLEIGKGRPCDEYDDDQCPIYDVIDWNKPGQTIAVLAGSFVALLLVLSLYYGFVRCRSACARGRDVEVVEVAK